MNVFSSDAVLAALAETYFPGRDAHPAIYSVAGSCFRLLEVDGRPETGAPYVDFWEPTDGATPSGALAYLPRASLGSVDAMVTRPDVPRDGGLAPFIEWSRVSTRDDLDALIAERNRGYAADTRRQRRRLEREVGALRYTFEDPDPAMLDRCVQWKGAQRPSSTHLATESQPTKFLHDLHRRDVLKISTLHAGDVVLAVHLGLVDAERFYSLVPAYDDAFNRYSPGRLLLDHLLDTSIERGDLRFEFLIGHETYKWLYATDARIVESLGRTPVRTAATNRMRRIKRSLRRQLERRRRP